MKIEKVLIVDPPSGWKYGFPKVYPEDGDYKKQLKDSGYPEDQIEFALKHSRYWEEEIY